MILYVDETESDDLFIVAGLLTQSKDNTDLVFKQFNKKVKKFPISPKEKEKVFREFKAILLDKHYQKVKICMIEYINKLDYSIYYSIYSKNGENFYQFQKEQEYIRMLGKIVSSIEEDIDIIFDAFKKKDFEEKIIGSISKIDNVLSIRKQDSQLESGLKFIDNICSSIRLYRTKQNKVYYHLLSGIHEV